MPPTPPPHPNCETHEILSASCGHILFLKRNDTRLHDDRDQGPPEPCMLGHYHYIINEELVCERCQMVQRGATDWEEATDMAYDSIVEHLVSNELPFTFQFHPEDTEYSLDPQIIADRISMSRILIEVQEAAKREEVRIIRDRKLERIQAVIKPIVGKPRGETCSICLQGWETQGDSQEGEAPIKLPCEHEYGKNCIIEWLMANGTCPECRTKFID